LVDLKAGTEAPMTQSIFASIFSQARTGIFGSSSRSKLISSSFRINAPANSGSQDQATKVTLSLSSRAKAGAAQTANAAATITSRGGILGQFLASIASVTDRLSQLQDKLSSDGLTNDQKAAYATEIKGLTSEYDRIIQSDSYKQITLITQQVQQSLQNGGSKEGLYSSLSSLSGLLGDNFLSIVRNGDLLKANSLSDSISKIGSVDSSKLGSDKAILNDIITSVHNAANALSGGSLISSATKSSAIPVIQVPGDSITPTQLTFAGAEDISLALRSYSASDMIKLASVHADINPVSVLMLVSNPLKDGEGRNKSQLNDPQDSNL
jgi:hypothetical protein